MTTATAADPASALSSPKAEPPVVSVVIAVLNEAENIEAVTEETLAAFEGVAPFEIVYVDDGSTDATAEKIRAFADRNVRLVRHERRAGKSQAVRTGVVAARGRWVGTMDGDGQNDPKDLVAMLKIALAESGSPLVAGVRRRRHDPLSRRIATRFANGLRQALLNDGCPDTGCGLKLFERDAFLQIPVFEGAHRFYPAMFKSYGHPLRLHDTNHRPRAAGRSKYSNLGRALVGIGDLLGVMWLRSRTRAPKVLPEQ